MRLQSKAVPICARCHACGCSECFLTGKCRACGHARRSISNVRTSRPLSVEQKAGLKAARIEGGDNA